MNVLLVSHSFEKKSHEMKTVNHPYSLGLAYMASYIEWEGHQVDVLWMDVHEFDFAHERILEHIQQRRPDVLGLQMFSMNRVSSYRLIEQCTQEFPGLRIIVGGIHATALPQQIVEKFKNVIVVIGEGEQTMVELLAAFEKNVMDLSHIQGIAYWNGQQVCRTQERELLKDLDSLPHPKHEIYFDEEPKRTMAHIITTRGCPFQCSFCCLHLISQRKYRKRDIGDVVDEIALLKEKYSRLESVHIHDDVFTLDNQRVIEFCKQVIKRNLNLRFIASARVKPISDEMFAYMEKAGFEKIMFGLETGSANLMKSIRKGITPDDVIDLFKKLRKYKFHVTTFLIVGFPGEDDNTVSETIGLVKKIQRIKYSYIVGVGKLIVYPGTEVYEIMKSKGCISDDYWLEDGDVPFYTVEHDEEALDEYCNRIMDNVSIAHILKFKGFVHHFMSMPGSVLKFAFTNKQTFKSVVAVAIKSRSENMYQKLYKLYKGN